MEAMTSSLPPIALVGAESVTEVASLIERLRAREIVRATVALARKDGSTFQASIVGAPIIDPSGRVTHLVGVIRDITEDLRLREQLVRGERLSAIGEFVSGVAHELNNPLQSVIGTLELIRGATAEPGTRTDIEQALSDAARRLLLVAAAEPVGDPLLLLAASERLGIALSATDAETDALLALGERVTFRHPLVRSAVYRTATREQRREVHLALADATRDGRGRRYG